MPSSKPWLDGPTPEDHARAQIWQGLMVFIIGASLTAVSYFVLGIVWIWTVIAAVCGMFWLLVGLVRLWTGYE